MPEDSQRPGISRRTVIAGAAWSVPVVAAAVATPLAAASAVTPGLAFTGASSSLLELQLLDGGGTLSAQALITVPTELTLTNGLAPLDAAPVSFTVAVGRPSGINIPVGRARGFGVYSLNGATSIAGERTTEYQSATIIGQYGFPATSWNGARTVSVPSNGALEIPITFGLAGVSTGIAISALAAFPVTASVTLPGGATYSAQTVISVPVGAGVL